jgi:microcin C transport system substrate-binding protein
VFVAGTMPVFSRKWGGGKKFDQIVTEHPIVSGPYLIDKVDMPRRIEFRRNPDYWGRDLPVRRGHFNFDRVVYRCMPTRRWRARPSRPASSTCTRSTRARLGAPARRREVGRRPHRQAHLPTASARACRRYLLNLRRPMFQDIRVREALG